MIKKIIFIVVLLNVAACSGLRTTDEAYSAHAENFDILFLQIPGGNTQERAMALISIAHPDVRSELLDVAKERKYVFADQVLPLGSHDMFISDVVAVNAEEGLIHPRSGAFQFYHADPICFAHGRYFALGRLVGTFGFSVRKKAKSKRRRHT